ncbi:electron bifurcating hydrogenase subunit HydC [Thermoanaerobacter kivui]|uniref:Electron bifurcating hydrogenase subunit HydC n=2 Tax=Thermoanaerobacter kivui TaxID=2325 RepID=A0A097ATI0_THEKI|nr:NADH-quinone oxidoreductase subunit NuoE [Thermoanaerobacter kivui]8A6T_C Chain C, Electron bifurcating hydrogenase subunit HydC [Thermoanaerobacter kivui]8A6T_F Chain F, Electron bifurcating hydrogenase subunit HydC [Thermoanaerobacter kivui]8BEW_C Chain C, Electron bifurcating hydrogenase subunit HydC [Thermoanaerobacter kivui]8BEW_F Chain F, Electron bifurcating hydrogenase subunit HydC [Thermoanaerobacter kivui]AIS53104.1 electron bifurcating hydrogenase subunit HydC [Thermoanaerobacter
MCNCCCKGSKDPRFEKVDEILSKLANERGALIAILQHVQHEFGYLPEDVIFYIASKTGIPASKIYGVATFYAQFHLKPRGKYVIRVCLGTACHVKGANKILAEFEKQLGIKAGETTSDLKFTLERVGCLGACGLAPTVMVNEKTYGKMTPEKVSEVLKEYSDVEAAASAQ